MDGLKREFESRTESVSDYCDKHDCQKVRIKRTGKIVCIKCGHEAIQKQAEERGQKAYEQEVDRRRQYYLHEFCLMDTELAQATFDNFKTATPEQKADFERVKAEARAYLRGGQFNLILIGESGAGKSHLAYSSIKAISDYTKKTATLVNVVDLIAKIKDDFQIEQDFIKTLADMDYLVLDDLGTEQTTKWSSNLIYSLLNKRVNTIITTNLTPSELAQRYGKRLFSRIFKGTGDKHVYEFQNKTDRRMATWQ